MIPSFYYLRILSIIFIVIGHLCHVLPNTYNMAWYFGYTFVYVFFLISAILLSIKHKPLLTWKGFMHKRFIRISSIYYPFLIICIIILLITGNNISLTSIISHFTYTNYFLRTNICGISFGHLWFMSMIMACYIIVWLLFRTIQTTKISHMLFNIDKSYQNVNKFKWVGTLSLIILMSILPVFNIPGRVILIITSFILFYDNATSILKYIKNASPNTAIISLITINTITIFGFISFNLDSFKLIRDWLTFFLQSAGLLYFIDLIMHSNKIKSLILFQIYRLKVSIRTNAPFTL